MKEILGKTFDTVERRGDVVALRRGGDAFVLYHECDCCETVELIDVCGDLEDLAGSPVLTAECWTNANDPPPGQIPDYENIWTFYRIGTARGLVTLRWWGSSNGYYSVSVDHAQVSVTDADVCRKPQYQAAFPDVTWEWSMSIGWRVSPGPYRPYFLAAGWVHDGDQLVRRA